MGARSVVPNHRPPARAPRSPPHPERACFQTSAMVVSQPHRRWLDSASLSYFMIICLVCASDLSYAQEEIIYGITGAQRAWGSDSACIPGDKFMGEACDRNALAHFAERVESWGIASPWPVHNGTSYPCDTRGAAADVLLGHPSLTWLGVHCKMGYPGLIEQPGPGMLVVFKRKFISSQW